MKILNLNKTKLWIVWIFVRNFGCNIIRPPYRNKMTELGFKKEWFDNIDIISTPLCFMAAYFSRYLLDSKKINKTIWWIMLFTIPFAYFDYYIYRDYVVNKDTDQTFVFMIISSFFSVIHDFVFILDIAFMNIICDIRMGCTHQTL